MGNRLALLTAAVLLAGFGGCCRERVWRCPDGQCGILSGRMDGCSNCTHCEGCGQMLGRCRCHPWQALKRRVTCGEGCGEFYWDEWHSDPPAPCDPCDEYCGNFVGRRCCPPTFWQRSDVFLLGRRGCAPGCDTCGPNGCADGSCTALADPLLPEHAMAEPMFQPPPAPRTQTRSTPRPMPTPADEPPELLE
jgi:hypothetical protein